MHTWLTFANCISASTNDNEFLFILFANLSRRANNGLSLQGTLCSRRLPFIHSFGKIKTSICKSRYCNKRKMENNEYTVKRGRRRYLRRQGCQRREENSPSTFLGCMRIRPQKKRTCQSTSDGTSYWTIIFRICPRSHTRWGAASLLIQRTMANPRGSQTRTSA